MKRLLKVSRLVARHEFIDNELAAVRATLALGPMQACGIATTSVTVRLGSRWKDGKIRPIARARIEGFALTFCSI